MRRRLIITIVLIIVVATIFGWYASRPAETDGQKTPTNEKIVNEKDIAGTTCELGATYRRTATRQSGCSCPDGYSFDVTVVGYEQCPDVEEECPILDVMCIQQ